MPEQYAIVHIAIAISIIIEQVCFMLFSKYPYSYGIPIISYTVARQDICKYNDINEQLTFLETLLSHSDQYVSSIRINSKEIYIRGRFKGFALYGGLWLIGANVYLRDVWRVTIRVGVFTSLLLVYLLVEFCILGSPAIIAMALLVISLAIAAKVAEYRIFRDYLTDRLAIEP